MSAPPSPSRRAILAALAAMGAAPPALAAGLGLAAGPGLTFYVVAWEPHGGLVGIGRDPSGAWECARAELLLCTLECAESDGPEDWPDPEAAAAVSYAECVAEAVCFGVHVADEDEAWRVVTQIGERGDSLALRIWRRAFPVEGVDPIAARLDAEKREEQERARQRKAENAAMAEESAARYRAEADAREAERRKARTPEENERSDALMAVAGALGGAFANRAIATADLQRAAALLGGS